MRKKGRHLFVILKTNLFSATTLPLWLCTSLIFIGDVISIITRTLSRLTSIPLWDTMNPKNFPAVTLNAHLFGFSFML